MNHEQIEANPLLRRSAAPLEPHGENMLVNLRNPRPGTVMYAGAAVNVRSVDEIKRQIHATGDFVPRPSTVLSTPFRETYHTDAMIAAKRKAWDTRTSRQPDNFGVRLAMGEKRSMHGPERHETDHEILVDHRARIIAAANVPIYKEHIRGRLFNANVHTQ